MLYHDIKCFDENYLGGSKIIALPNCKLQISTAEKMGFFPQKNCKIIFSFFLEVMPSSGPCEEVLKSYDFMPSIMYMLQCEDVRCSNLEIEDFTWNQTMPRCQFEDVLRQTCGQYPVWRVKFIIWLIKMWILRKDYNKSILHTNSNHDFLLALSYSNVFMPSFMLEGLKN